MESDDDVQETENVAPQFEVQDDGMIEYMHNINIMQFPDEIIRTHKQTGKIVPLRDIVRGPIEPTVTGNGTRPIKAPVTRIAIFLPDFFILKTNRYHD